MSKRKEYASKNVITDLMINWGIGVDYRPSEVFTKPQPTSYLNPNGQGLRADLMSLLKVAEALAYQEGYNDGVHDTKLKTTKKTN